MENSFYKKSGIMLMSVARDFFTLREGDRIPTIYEYTDRFGVSRGIVQNAIETLVEDGSIQIEKRGVKGTFLTGIRYEKLYRHTNWGTITGTMPVPLNPCLSSLTTGVSTMMEKAPFPFSFAFVTGSEMRLQALKSMVYDFIIVSKSTAQIYLGQYAFLHLCAVLDGCVYSPEYVIYFMDQTKNEIEDGMRVGIDPTCLDQATLTRKLCAEKQVTYVEFPYIGFLDIAFNKQVDCVVYRRLDGHREIEEEFHIVPLRNLDGFSPDESETPVVLTNTENYGIDALIRNYLDPSMIKKIQDEVIRGKRWIKFY